MSDDKLVEKLDDENASAEDLLSALDGEVALVHLARILHSERDNPPCFVYPEVARLKALSLLPVGSVEALEVVIGHLRRVLFHDHEGDDLEHYFRRVDEQIPPLSRPYHYQDVVEIANEVAASILGNPPDGADILSPDSARRIMQVCDLIMGGGFCPDVSEVLTMDGIVEVLERNI